MKWFVTTVACCLLTVATSNFPAQSQTVFKKALQQKYGFKSVSCNACHQKGKDADGKSLSKEHRNEFGEALHGLLAEKNASQRIKDAKKAGADAQENERGGDRRVLGGLDRRGEDGISGRTQLG